MSLLLALSGSVVGRFIGDLPTGSQVWSPTIQTWTFGNPGMLLPPFRQTDWPLPTPSSRLDQTWTQTFPPELRGQDQLPVGEVVYELAPGQKPPPPENLRRWEWQYNLNLIGQDRVPGKRQIDLPLWVPEPSPRRGWEWPLQLDLLPFPPLSVRVTELWPLPPQRAINLSTWSWQNTQYYGKDFLVAGAQVTDLPPPPKALYGTWTWQYNLNLIAQDKLPVGAEVTDLPQQPLYAINLRTWLYNWIMITLTAGPTPFNQLDWPVPKTPQPIFQNLTFSFNLNLIGQDQLPNRQQDWPIWRDHERSIQLRTWIDQTKLLLRGQDLLPFNQKDWPVPDYYAPADNKRARNLDSWTWQYNLNLINQDKTPFRQTDWPIWRDYERSIQLRTWINPPFILAGQDQLPFRQQDWPNPRGHEYAVQLRTWVDYIVQSVAASTPFNQEDWPTPKDFERAIQLKTWIDVTKFWLIPPPMPFNQYDWPVPIAHRQAALNWVANYNLNLIGKDFLPLNQLTFALPNRGPAPIEQTIAYREPFAPPIIFIGAQYFLLQPHYILNRWIDAWTTVTEGVEIPIGWIPTPAVDPLNVQAVQAFYNAGPRTAWLGPEWSWQNYQTLTRDRQNIMLQAATRWVTTGNGFYSLTGLGAGFPPVGV